MRTLLLLLLSPAWAGDTWTAVRSGVDYLHRSTGGATPQSIHAVRIDLSRPEVGLRASMDASGTERQVVTSTFASSVGALVAINGDWSDGSTPVGLAIGNGWLWHNHYDDPNIGATWGYFACDVFNNCAIEALPTLSEAWWFGSPGISPYRYYNAVGANGNLLLDDGVRGSGCYDGCDGDSCRNPRSAVCLESDGTHLWFFVVDGRQTGASGMTCSETRDLAQELGCWDAAMLDGGGSSTLWVNGAMRNSPSGGSQRTVANHIGIVYADTPDSRCALSAGAWCEGSQLRTCNGSKLVNDGDCGYYGLACQEDGDWAFCVDPRCPNGDGTAAVCLDSSRVASCTDGVYGEGDCGVFGLACGTDSSGTACMDPRCSGPNSGFCTDAGLLAMCSGGVYGESACTAEQTCVEADGTASCVTPGDSADPGGDGGGDDSPTPDAQPGPPPGVATRLDTLGCASTSGSPTLSALLLGWIASRRARKPNAEPAAPPRSGR